MTLPDLQEMRTLLPVLNEIDDQTLLELDHTEWYRPSVGEAHRLQAAADRLGVYVMTYRAGGQPQNGRGLCNLIAAATLKGPEISEIARLEAQLHDAVVVAYARPARWRH